MKDKETGSLSAKPFLDLLLDFYNGSVTGSLKLERAPLQKAVYFRDGQILFAASNDPKDQLASILVEEGKLGPEQMQVAQARVGPGSPLAKVLTELGYISPRELSDAARLKVEKILTDLYSWTDGTYQFATKSLPKGAIDLELSTPHVLLNSMRRIQDRQWVLQKLESLDSVLAPGIRFENFLLEAKADEAAAEVLRLADGARSVKDIAASVSLGEFEVCKILSAGLVLGAVELSAGPSAAAASEEAFDISINADAPPSFEADSSPSSFPTEATVFDAAPVDAGSDTTALDTSLPVTPSADMPEAGTIFGEAEQAQENPSSFSFGGDDDPMASPPPIPSEPSEPGDEPDMSPSFESLNIHDPEPADDDDDEGMVISRKPPVPQAQGGSALSSILRVGLAAIALAGIGAALYYFVWPMVFPSDAGSSPAPKTASTRAPAPTGKAPFVPVNTPAPDRGNDSTSPENTGQTGPSPVPTGNDGSPPSNPTASPSPAPPPKTIPRPAPSPPSPPPSTSSTPARPAPRPAPPPSNPAGGGGNGRQLLASGNLRQASQSFLRELSTSPNKFTIAVGLYCDETNAARTVENAGNSSDLYVLPAQLQGRSCYRVLWGLFDSREAASGAIGSIPGSIRSGDSTPVPVSQFLR